MRRAILAAAILALLALAACQQGVQSVNYYTGMQGLELTFVQNTLPKEVYEGMIVPLSAQLWNKGAADVNYSEIVFSLK